MGEKPTPPERRQSPTTARHGKKRAGHSRGSAAFGRARPARPTGAPRSRPAARTGGGISGRALGGDPRRRTGPCWAGPRPAARLRKHPRTEKGNARAPRGTTGRKRTTGEPTRRGCRPRRAGHPATRARGAKGARAAKGEPPRLARPAGRATRIKGGPPYGPREHTAQRGGPTGGGSSARVSAAHGERGQTARCAKQGAPPALTKPRARPGFPCGMSSPRE